MATNGHGSRKSGAVSINNLSGEIADLLAEYTSEVTEGLDKAKNKAANNGIKKLRGTSPDSTGDYSRGWRKKKENTAVIVHNETDYRLTHLLEKGHVTRDGTSRSKKFVHIAPVETQMIKEFEEAIERVVKGGTV